jgi:hypothetical protein
MKWALAGIAALVVLSPAVARAEEPTARLVGPWKGKLDNGAEELCILGTDRTASVRQTRGQAPGKVEGLDHRVLVVYDCHERGVPVGRWVSEHWAKVADFPGKPPVLGIAAVYHNGQGKENRQEPAPPSAEEDLKTLLGKDGKAGVWELQVEKTHTLARLEFRPRAPDAPKDADLTGELRALFPAGKSSLDFLYRLEVKEKERFLVIRGKAFKEGIRIPYRLKDGKLQLEGGAADVPELGKLELKGEWKRIEIK